MSTATRRAMLSALALVPAIAAPAVAAVSNADAALLRLGADLQAAQAAQEAALEADRLEDSEASEEALMRADGKLYELEALILETPAHTPAGRALKAKIALAKLGDEGGEGTYGEAWARSALADVIAAG